MISHISALVLTIQTIALLEIKYKMIICLFVSAGCVLPEIYSLRNKSSAHFIFPSISRKREFTAKRFFVLSTGLGLTSQKLDLNVCPKKLAMKKHFQFRDKKNHSRPFT